MNKNCTSSTSRDLDISLEVLDQWESDLDQFSAEIMQRLSQLAGKRIERPSPSDRHDHSGASERDGENSGSDDQAELLRSLRELTQ